MREVRIRASKEYSVYIGSGLLSNCGDMIMRAAGGQSVMLVTDDVVEQLYADRVETSLEASGYRVYRFVIHHGEASKNADNYVALLNVLAEAGLTRTDLIVALGGGVTGDLAGFAAATYLRGISYAQLPTTILAAVDSSVGGKTAIDLTAGKNLAGAFHQPDTVICDIDTLQTLKPEVFSDGCAEIIKYGMISNGSILDELQELVPFFPGYGDNVSDTWSNDTGEKLAHIIAKCVRIKGDIVEKDEFDTGKRQLLNYGHTIGHAIEVCSGYSISHGRAVATGMVYMMRLFHCKKPRYMENVTGKTEHVNCCTDYGRLVNILRLLKLPTETEYSAEELFRALKADKKRCGERINIVIPEKAGVCRIENIMLEELYAKMITNF